MWKILRLIALAIAVPLASHAQEPGGDVPVPEDLHAVLMLRGKECKEIVHHERLGPADYRVTCSEGQRYRIRVEDEAHVVVEELE